MKKIYFALLFILTGTIAIGQNPQLLKDIYPGATGSGIQQIVKTSNYTFFNAEDDDPDADRGLYRTDGTQSGTIKLNLIYPTYNSTKADKLTALGNKIIFAGDNFPNYGEIWASDGTQAGTIALERFQPTEPGRVPVMNLAKMGSSVLYGIVDNNNHSLLKKTDGTAAGTTVLFDFSTILPGAPDLALFQEINGILYFNVYNIGGAGEDQLWRSDGTVAGTYMIKDFGLNQYVASGYMPAGNLFYLMIVTPGTGNVLWKSDGTATGTSAVKTIGTTGNNNYPQNLAIGSTLYFAGLDGNGKELWKTDGTAGGTVMVSDINGGAASSNPIFFTLLNNNIYFSATTANEGAELWKFDGVNTSLVKDINPGAAGSAPGSLVVSNNTILFRASTSTNGAELWITDGTAANTLQVADINPGIANAFPNILTPGNPVYFSANNGVNGTEIFKYDNSQGLAGLHKLYVNDNSTAGDVFTTAIGSNSNNGTRTAPVATVTYALTIAAAGDTIIVDAGTYIEQVIIDKGITIKGAGQNLTSFITPTTPLVPAPGPFTEIGLFETTQGIGDVHISNLSITSNNSNPSQNIIIQSGGSVKNCKLLNGGQGVFFRIESGARNAVVENNDIQPTGIGVNCQGSGLTASILNNTISNMNGFYAGIFAGLDFGPIVQLTITNNIINNNFGEGLLTNSYTSNITQNSITGTGSVAIQQFSGNRLNATCNWFGTSDYETIRSKIQGNVNYTPWLTNGTDTSTATGFQPMLNVCNGKQNKFYVNDGSQTGDVFTTAIGNDANMGLRSAPFATINYALSVAQAGDTIFVDAGTYNLASNLNLNKSITIYGSNYLISPNNTTDKTQYNTGRNAESIITGSTVLIGADNIKMNGLRFSTVATAVSLFANYSHVKFDKNIFDVAGSGASLNLQGVSANPIVAFDFSVTDCRFDRKDLLNGSSVNLGLVKSLWIDNNSFIETPTTGNPYRGIALRTVPGQSVEGISFSNNYIKKLNIGVLPTIVQDFGVSNNTFDSCNTGYNHNPNGAVSNNIFIRTNTFTNLRVGRSILVRGGSGGGINNLNIIDNTINQEVDGINGIVGMIQLDFALGNTYGDVSVLGNKINISGNYLNTIPLTNSGIILIGKHSNTKVWYNDLNFTAINAYYDGFRVLPNVPTGIFISTDGGTGSGNIPANAVINITNNKINGFKNSVGIYDPTATGLNSFVGYGNLTAGATVNINNNSFTADSMSVDNGVVGQIINSTCNWYGTADAEVLIPKISSLVTYSPWLTNGTDTDAGSGFEPMPNVCNGRQNKFYVNDSREPLQDVFTTAAGNDANSGIPSAPLLTISAALAKCQNGDTIYVDYGVYSSNSNITIDKSVTLLGINYQVSPNEPINPLVANPLRTDETIVENHSFILGSSDIRIKGFFFEPNSKTQILQTVTTNDFDNIEIEKNVFSNVSNLASVNITGKQVTPLVTVNCSITDNRFEKTFTPGGTAVSINAIDGVQINNNVFTVITTVANTVRIQTGIGVGALTGGIVISNNKAYQQNFFVNGISAKKTTISFNTVDDCNRFVFASSSNVNPNEVEITDNIVTNSKSTGGPVLSYARSNGTNLSTPNIARIERNTISLNGTGLASIAQALIAPTIDNLSLNTQVFIRDNMLTISGDFSSQSNPNFYVSAIRFLNNSRQAIVERNEMLFTATNYNSTNKFGIGILHSGLTGGTQFDFLNNKVSGFPTSVGIQSSTSGAFGNLPIGVTVNIHNNSFMGDVVSINNGTVGQTINATCNWYGVSAAQNVSPKITEATVNYSPWLTNGTDADAATGFQPAANSCNGVPVDADIITVTNVTCNGAANGSIDVLMEEGVAPFTYQWFKDDVAGFSTTEDLTNLAPGNYKLIVTDVNGSVDSVFTTITEPDVLTSTAEGINNICFGASNGEATVFPVGGTTPYTYMWNNGQTTESISNLSAGTYTVTVTDANGCTTTSSYEVTEPTLLTASISNNSTACSNIATVTAGGGTTGYTYLWSNGATTATISSVPVGTYSVMVTDANGCTATASITLSVGEAFNPSASVTNVSCFGANNGVITVTNANGTAPFKFSIDGVNFVPGSFPYNFNNLGAGTYTIAVRDVNGCTGFVSKTITQPAQLVATLGTVQNTCAGASTGSINVTVSGGTTAYTYNWTSTNGFTSTQLNISNLTTGNYTLTVKDKNNCTVVVNATVNPFPAISLTEVISHVSCKGGSNGAINITVGGGTGSGFTYSWTGTVISSSEDLNNLVKGTNYKLTVTDIGSGCTISKTYTITEPASNLAITASKTNVVDCSTLGTITIAGSGGTPGYLYSINGINYFASGLFTGLSAGNYTAWVKDANGCTKSSAVLSLTDAGGDAYESNNSKSQAKTFTGSTINARLAVSTDVADWFKFTTPSGTNISYSLNMSTGNYIFNLYAAGNNTPALTPVSSGIGYKNYLLAGNTTYYISVTGGLSFNCYSLTVTSPASVPLMTKGIEKEVMKFIEIDKLTAMVYPNPHRGNFNIRIASPENGIAKVELFTVGGQKLATKIVSVQKSDNNYVPFNNIRQGTIFYRVQIGKHTATGKVVGIE